jgi:tetrahydromethanopterin S-methyltransferase subunit C
VEWVIGTWAAALLTIVLSVIMTARRQAIVIPRTQKDAPPFWERNRDEIAINAIFTVIGGVLGIVGTLLIQSLVDR